MSKQPKRGRLKGQLPKDHISGALGKSQRHPFAIGREASSPKRGYERKHKK